LESPWNSNAPPCHVPRFRAGLDPFNGQVAKNDCNSNASPKKQRINFFAFYTSNEVDRIVRTTARGMRQRYREYLGCELNPEYGALQQKRLDRYGLFASPIHQEAA